MTGRLERLSFAALCELLPADVNWGDTLTPDILREVVLAAESREREACAKVCEAMIDPVSAAWRDKRPDEAAEFDASDAGKQACADAIRMRSNK